MVHFFWFDIIVYYMKMKNTYKDLHNLTERAGILHYKITERINYEGLHFCRDCAKNGRYCGIADLRIEDKEKLIAIRDSLKEIQNMLEFYQVLLLVTFFCLK